MEQIIIKANDIQSDNIIDIIKEIESNEEMSEKIDRVAIATNKANGDVIEAVASHIYYTDTDFICNEDGSGFLNENEDDNSITMKDVKKAIEEQTDVQAIIDDSGEYYFGTYEVKGEKVRVIFDLREDYVKWNENYNYKRALESESYLSKEEELELERLSGGDENDPDVNEGYYCNDGSNHCDWDNPSSFEVID